MIEMPCHKDARSFSQRFTEGLLNLLSMKNIFSRSLLIVLPALFILSQVHAQTAKENADLKNALGFDGDKLF